ncbi:hypothetical protein VISI1226_07468 [Vibrio sinaloensis DSM 21326]|uniref:Uncharacterized protein n=1 Tax=Vibrio sinaloensis DSM 21326 TaxID=945550 RepID=E8MAH8_PHOS4|nr:hypothetical protein [Vibrio sinaloensis]EGA69127.1 hypothetical protein VISI1226_07468 [Vibrio sinaloensis DSM 21326]
MFKKHLNDPVNWVEFIRENNIERQEQKWWRDHLNLDYTFNDEFEA